MNLKLLVSPTTINIKQSPTPSMANTNPLTQGLFASCLPILLYVTYATFQQKNKCQSREKYSLERQSKHSTRLKYHIDVGIIR